MKELFAALILISTAAAVYEYKKIISFITEKSSEYISGIRKLVKNSMADIDSKRILKGAAAVLAVSVCAGMLVESIIPVIAAVPVMVVFPKLYINHIKKKYINDYQKGLVSLLESLISGLKAGLSIMKALHTAALKDNGPIGKELSIVLSEVEMGKSLSEALEALGGRIPVRENEIIISAIITSIESGGNITEVLSGILETIRKREAVNKEVQALTSQGVMSGFVVGLLPFFLLAMISVIDPAFVEPLFKTNAGMAVLGAAVLMELAGAFFIKKIITID
ncbi:MAG: type II secretion system F family protein [Candidatus Goldiibacteriota bacterium]